MEDKLLTIGSYYAPNKGQAKFMEKLLRGK